MEGVNPGEVLANSSFEKLQDKARVSVASAAAQAAAQSAAGSSAPSSAPTATP